jgi:hypothetical protein
MTKVKAQLRTNLKGLKKIDMKSIIKSVYYRLNGRHKVSELPKKYDDYYVCTIWGCGFILHFNGIWNITHDSGNVAYWRKLPKLPKVIFNN